MWIYNPPEPCANPPAGHCQCTPCQWRVTEVVGPSVRFETLLGQDYFDFVGLPQSLSGHSHHAAWICRGLAQETPPPWHRFWRKRITAGGIVYHWWFGFGRWIIPGASSISPPKLDQVGWGLGLYDATNFRDDQPWNGITIEEGGLPGDVRAPLWLHTGRWYCWGENRLIFRGDLAAAVDPEQYITVEPAV